MALGSGIRKKPIPDPGSRIQGSKRHRIPDPDPQYWFKEESKKQYSRIWSQFRDFVPEHDFELAPPAEDSFSGILLQICNMYV